MDKHIPCHKCGHEVLVTALNCDKCGYEIEFMDIFAHQIKQTEEEDMDVPHMYSKQKDYLGNTYLQKDAFSHAEELSRKTTRNRWLTISILIIIIVLIIIMIN